MGSESGTSAGVCGEVFEAGDRSTWEEEQQQPGMDTGAASEFPPDLISSGEESDSSETNAEDSDSSTTDTDS
jgi:hypothetical protein